MCRGEKVRGEMDVMLGKRGVKTDWDIVALTARLASRTRLSSNLDRHNRP